ncbi:sensor histidine kinase NtrY-like [Roseiterribacter gracilis]|uniref:Nitrogen regulation protein n=1 Tax=Roseiterribacter gracilis TaxID=2812848 RepID=A0A8S8XB95_9PROT|nr:PAS domain-containing sensor histidine kinase [Rhodospirillales bacterium TMPK1]
MGFGNKLAVVFVVLAILAGGATYAALTAITPFGHPRTVFVLLIADLVVLLALGALLAPRLLQLYSGRRRGAAGTRLQGRFVFVFGMLAVTPAILMAVFSAVFFHFGVQTWFGDRVRTAVGESLTVAQAYLEEHKKTIQNDARTVALQLDQAPIQNLVELELWLQRFVARQNLQEAMIFSSSADGRGLVLARAGLSLALEAEMPRQDQIDQARQTGQPIYLVGEKEDRVRALIFLNRYVYSPDNAYLYVGRTIAEKVLGHMEKAESAVKDYTELEGRRSGLQITMSLIFLVVALLLLVVAIWFGVRFAKQLAQPLAELIDAAEQVRAGDLSARVVEAHRSDDEIAALGRAFNRMTSQLESQRRELIEANRQVDARRRFTETVLSGVSAGVLGLDQEQRITIANQAAMDFLQLAPGEMVGRPLVEIVPEFEPLLAQTGLRGDRALEDHLQLKRPGQPTRTLLVRIAAEPHADQPARGHVVTFDDITDLVGAQRQAAWADVARRIAHEIKNPLTPIQLSAERLKRKYLSEITSDPETFKTCTDTIVRQVTDIGRMVDEFSSFARMPAPVMRRESLTDLARQAVFLQRQAHARVKYEIEAPDLPVFALCDGRQIGQALTNLLQNAADAIDGRADGGDKSGHVWLRIVPGDRQVRIEVADDGKGLPPDRERLTEPYVTTRTKGTGLGLAIVKKIMEDHGGELALTDRPGGGAIVSLTFSVGAVESQSGSDESSRDDSANPKKRTATHGA